VSLHIAQALKNTRFKKKIIIGPAYDQGLIDKLERYAVDELTELIYKPKSLQSYIDESDASYFGKRVLIMGYIDFNKTDF